tara:strand:- start:5910 stop:6254 length:345 start_codon:yes stop_codon:yes gene_type:complete
MVQKRFAKFPHNPHLVNATKPINNPGNLESVQKESMSVGIESVGTLTGVSVFHEVTGLATGSFLGDDFPVTVDFYEITDAGHHGTHVCDTVLCLGFVGGEAVAVGKSVDDTTLL